MTDKTVRLRIGTMPNTKLTLNNICFPFEDSKVDMINGLTKELDEPFETLRDISIIMMEMVGAGVTRQLAREISKQVICSDNDMENILFDIFRKWSKMSEEGAEKKFLEMKNK